MIRFSIHLKARLAILMRTKLAGRREIAVVITVVRVAGLRVGVSLVWM
jgi:hypothetical protein